MHVFQVVLVICLSQSSYCARILGVIPTPSYSHQVVFQPLWKELSLRGHQVILLTTNPIKDHSLTNLTEIDLSFSYKFLEENLLEIINSSQNILKSTSLSIKSFANVMDAQLQHPQVKRLLQDPNEHFDLVIAEYFMAGALYFARRFNCPCIGVLSMDGNNPVYRQVGNDGHPIVYPDPFSRISGTSSIFDRIGLVMFELYFQIFDFNGEQQKVAKKHFGDDTPISEVLANVSLLFVNTDPIFHYTRALLPMIIPIGGNIARIPVNPLEKSVKKFLDEAHQGFIYFSLGSNVKSKDIPESTMDVVLETLREIPYRILWKYELDDLPNKPENVMISKWISQMEVLKHPNLKLFITHGGAQSMEETIQARVPVVGMPFFVDQPFNVQQMVSLGFALSVDYKTMSKETFKQAILEVINNDKYHNRIRELANLVEDQPMTGLERAVWWTEYVIRHKGAAHFKSPALDMPWYQYYFLDVISVLLFTLIGSLYFMVKVIKATLRALRRNIVRSKAKKN
ncbi:UDP-glucuronosyltransferase 2B15-like [Photinus pyralis]|uniref:UDP-glucuronosyltransferase 2B15-like n=1 Tax=Photinus pyralis TaxID=7054 RepID=UPI001266F8A9|nr:UDP-glucuronosyltransferase 2B15-like [Photinus pyralis]